MIQLEEIVNQSLMEEGQVVLSLNDLEITWEALERLFKGTFDQAKGYISIYDWENKVIGMTPTKQEDWAAVRHMTYNAYFQRFMPDIPGSYWEFNPYTKNMSSLINSNFNFEIAKYPTISKVDWTITLNDIKAGKEISFDIPYSLESVEILNGTVPFEIKVIEEKVKLDPCNKEDNYLVKYPFRPISETGDILDISGDLVNGEINNYETKGYLTFEDDYDTIVVKGKSKFLAILELDMTCELFYNWYKGNLLTMIGSIKKQIDLEGVGLPFNFNADELLNRGREIMTKVEELKGTKSHWSNF